MKCLKCGTNSLYRARSSGTCPQCGQAFAFEPKRGDLFTDAAFQAALQHLGKEVQYYHPRHLYFELARRRYAKAYHNPKGALIMTLVAGAFVNLAILGFFVGGLDWPWWRVELLYLSVLAFISRKVWLKVQSPQVRITARDYKKILARWEKVQGPIAQLMPDTLTPRQISAQHLELKNYAIDRLILCDKPEMVDFLIANQFHLEQKCAILSFNGYPRENFDTLKAMLQRSPHLRIYLIHNASTNGCRILPELKRPEWFPKAQIEDLGLHPRQAAKFKGLWEAANSPALPIPGYTETDRQWLATWQLDLMAIPPGKLLKHLRNQIQHHQQQVVDAYAAGEVETDLLIADSFSLNYDDGGDSDFG